MKNINLKLLASILTIGSAIGFSNAYASNKVEVKFEKSTCSMDRGEIVKREFKKIPSVKWVKLDFERMGDREIELYAREGKTISDAEIEAAAKRAGCDIEYVDRDR
jgi:hypothetical protein